MLDQKTGINKSLKEDHFTRRVVIERKESQSLFKGFCKPTMNRIYINSTSHINSKEKLMFAYLMSLLNVKGEKGQDLAEYALLIGFIAIVLIVAVTLLGTNLNTVFTNIANSILGA